MTNVAGLMVSSGGDSAVARGNLPRETGETSLRSF